MPCGDGDRGLRAVIPLGSDPGGGLAHAGLPICVTIGNDGDADVADCALSFRQRETGRTRAAFPSRQSAGRHDRAVEQRFASGQILHQQAIVEPCEGADIALIAFIPSQRDDIARCGRAVGDRQIADLKVGRGGDRYRCAIVGLARRRGVRFGHLIENIGDHRKFENALTQYAVGPDDLRRALRSLVRAQRPCEGHGRDLDLLAGHDVAHEQPFAKVRRRRAIACVGRGPVDRHGIAGVPAASRVSRDVGNDEVAERGQLRRELQRRGVVGFRRARDIFFIDRVGDVVRHRHANPANAAIARRQCQRGLPLPFPFRTDHRAAVIQQDVADNLVGIQIAQQHPVLPRSIGRKRALITGFPADGDLAARTDRAAAADRQGDRDQVGRWTHFQRGNADRRDQGIFDHVETICPDRCRLLHIAFDQQRVGAAVGKNQRINIVHVAGK